MLRDKNRCREYYFPAFLRFLTITVSVFYYKKYASPACRRRPRACGMRRTTAFLSTTAVVRRSNMANAGQIVVVYGVRASRRCGVRCGARVRVATTRRAAAAAPPWGISVVDYSRATLPLPREFFFLSPVLCVCKSKRG